MKAVCVFCGSSEGNDPAYSKAADDLAAALVSRGIELVYGGGDRGLMGRIARAVKAAGGKVTGIIPKAMTAVEGLSTDADTVLVKDMHSRKALMNERSDGFIALPGGFGTFEELLEMTTWAQLSIHSKPVGVLNIKGFYDPLAALVDRAVGDGFIREQNKKLMLFGSTPDELLNMMEAYTPPSGRYEIPWST
ncbi:hypothetical protein HK405_004409, partial [Cladochytrium tenue]